MKKKKYKLRKWVKVSILVLFVFLLSQPLKKDYISKSVIKRENLLTKQEKVIIAEGKVEEKLSTVQEHVMRDLQHSYTTRMTSYYSNDGYETGSITGSGLGVDDFSINEHGWYTYQGKLVIATATDYLLKYGYNLSDGVHTYKYYDELTLTIDGMDYPAIVLDSCGSSMSNGRIDLFVTDKEHIKDVEIVVKE